MTAVEPLPVRSPVQNFGVLKQWWSYGQTLKVREVLAEIWQYEQWKELGYESFRDACADMLGEEFPRLVVTERREAVAELTGRGMSTRAIAATLGVSHQTVANDREATGVKDLTPAPVTGLDGKRYTRNPITPQMQQAADDLMTSHVVRPEPGPPARAVCTCGWQVTVQGGSRDAAWQAASAHLWSVDPRPPMVESMTTGGPRWQLEDDAR